VLVRGVLRGEEDAAPKLAVTQIQALEDVKIKLPDALRIKVPLHSPDADLLAKLQAIFTSAPGTGKLMLRLEEPDQFAVDIEPRGMSVSADVLFIEQVESLVGRGGVQIIH
jgi:DNA polymerase-3 subunit alpha